MSSFGSFDAFFYSAYALQLMLERRRQKKRKSFFPVGLFYFILQARKVSFWIHAAPQRVEKLARSQDRLFGLVFFLLSLSWPFSLFSLIPSTSWCNYYQLLATSNATHRRWFGSWLVGYRKWVRYVETGETIETDERWNDKHDILRRRHWFCWSVFCSMPKSDNINSQHIH